MKKRPNTQFITKLEPDEDCGIIDDRIIIVSPFRPPREIKINSGILK